MNINYIPKLHVKDVSVLSQVEFSRRTAQTRSFQVKFLDLTGFCVARKVTDDTLTTGEETSCSYLYASFENVVMSRPRWFETTYLFGVRNLAFSCTAKETLETSRLEAPPVRST